VKGVENIRVTHCANHVRPQNWAKNPPGKEEKRQTEEMCHQSLTRSQFLTFYVIFQTSLKL